MNRPAFALSCDNTAFAERLLEQYLADPTKVPASWRDYFRELGASNGQGPHGMAAVENATGQPSRRPPRVGSEFDLARLQDRLAHLIRAYRVRGHLAAKLDPLDLPRPEPADLDPIVHGILDADRKQMVRAVSVGGPDAQTVEDLIRRLRNTYCRYIGVQFMHIDEPAVRDWLQERMESTENRLPLSREEQLRILTRLTDAVIFEQFVRKKYIGAKTFSLEGAESLIPLLDLAIVRAARQGIVEIVVGMAHRGRLNVLANIIGKSPQEIFWEFSDAHPELRDGGGDLSYHLGYSGDWQAYDGRRIHLSLCFNPSHLEFINPVALGRMRAKQDRTGDHDRQRGMCLLIHGDAAFAGEGVVQESLNLSQLAGYTTGGTVHVIVNNQIGFTTPPDEARSTRYASDVARMLQSPIFHVNGEHPEAVAQVVELAMDFRARFSRDVVIDLYCYRRWGHNETDEPGFTQPVVYQAIDHQRSVRDGYLDHLLELKDVTRDEADRIAAERHEMLEAAFKEAQDQKFTPSTPTLTGIWQGFVGGDEPHDVEKTSVAADRLAEILVRLTKTPDGFHLHKNLQRSVDQRLEMAEGKRPLDWSAAEALAFATLATDGVPIRLSGQDAQRGTFSQRHAMLHDIVDGHTYAPFEHLDPKQARVEILNSPLSEAGVMGFEFGYSLDCPEGLIAWEGQFGDFCNAAQVVIDQFIVVAADRWRRLSGLVLLLPHGFEGMGPEHSSARLERFLSLTANDNIQIVYPTTPAQYFHLLRRQVLRRWRKPLIVMTPKSLLRNPQAVSALSELSEAAFQPVIDDQRLGKPAKTARVLLCAGKVYYDLVAFRERQKRDDVAIVRVEQLYPIPMTRLRESLESYGDATSVCWVQEEPENMGAASFWKLRIGDRLLDRFPLRFVSRPESASPATGSKGVHKREQQRLMETAFE
jgi:2-oxoglutarate dehydrogenase E1 component